MKDHSRQLDHGASVVAGQSATGSGTSLPGTTSNENLDGELNCLRIGTRPTPDDANPATDTCGRYLPTDSANTHIRNALLRANGTKDVQVKGIGMNYPG